MLFNSISFLIFFPAVTILYFLLPHKTRWFMLLAASVFFYMFFIPKYIFILVVTIVIDYFAGIIIEKEKDQRKKRLFLLISILSTCTVLVIFKYFNFINGNIARAASLLHWNYPIESLSIILPIGLSFHTFQSLSYVIEVYRGKQKAERHFGIYSLYVMFYPQLVAGPIERPQNLLHQFYEKHVFDYQRITDGLKLMAWGMFKKVVIADRLAVFVDKVYSSPNNFSPFSLFLATILFAFQIYADFSGYSDIAIGSAQVMGFRLMRNFNRPYFSKSVPEFWRRWHISLSTWFKDYVYIPLGGNRVGMARWMFNTLVVFTLSGFWHGASWTFIAWGMLHGIFIILSRLTLKFRNKAADIVFGDKFLQIRKACSVLITFALVCFAWIFFRASSMTGALHIVEKLSLGIKDSFRAFRSNSLIVSVHIVSGSIRTGVNQLAGGSQISLLIAVLSILLMGALHLMQRKKSIRERVSGLPAVYRWVLYVALIVNTLIFGYFSNQNFIYFQF